MKNGKHAKNTKVHKKGYKLFYFKIYFCLFILILNIIIFSSIDYSNTNFLSNTKNESSTNVTNTTIDDITIATSASIIEENPNSTNTNTNTDTTIDTVDNIQIKTSTINTEEMSIEIEDLIESFKLEYNLNSDNFAFFYYNLDTSEQYFFNENTLFTAASTVKLPVAMLYYDKINQGELSLSSTLLYKANDYEAGCGSTSALYSPGEYIPLSFLLEQSIVNSDNTAVNILLSNDGYSKCKKEIVSKYTNQTVSDDFYTSNLTYANYAYDILNYLYSHMSEYSPLIEYLKISSNGEYLKKYITDYDVAHKYGSYNGYVHDYGIVFGNTTYLIGVFTKNVSNAPELIANISLEIFNIS